MKTNRLALALLLLSSVAVFQLAAQQTETDHKPIEEVKAKAEAGDADSEFQLGRRYDRGEGVVKDCAQAVQWYRKAAEQNLAEAQFYLGLCYHTGEGVAKDMAEAVKWYRKAAEQNHAKAQGNLGFCYEKGNGVAKDQVEAVKWYRKATDQNDAKAQFRLGFCYENGQGVAEDQAEAVKWYRKAVEQNLAEAQYLLGFCYFNGKGVPKNRTVAVQWFRKAAEQNLAVAQSILGHCYAQSQGVAKDYVQAYTWCLLAGGQGNEDSKRNMTMLENKMTREQIAAGQKLARNFKPRKVPSAASDSPSTDIVPPPATLAPSPNSTTTTRVVLNIDHAQSNELAGPSFRIALRNWAANGDIAIYLVGPKGEIVTVVPHERPIHASPEGGATLFVPYTLRGLYPGVWLLTVAGRDSGIHHCKVEIPKVFPPNKDHAKERLSFKTRNILSSSLPYQFDVYEPWNEPKNNPTAVADDTSAFETAIEAARLTARQHLIEHVRVGSDTPNSFHDDFQYDRYPDRERIKDSSGSFVRKLGAGWLKSEDWGETGTSAKGNLITKLNGRVDLASIPWSGRKGGQDKTQGADITKKLPIEQTNDSKADLTTFELTREHPRPGTNYTRYTFLQYKGDSQLFLHHYRGPILLRKLPLWMTIDFGYFFSGSAPATLSPSPTASPQTQRLPATAPSSSTVAQPIISMASALAENTIAARSREAVLLLQSGDTAGLSRFVHPKNGLRVSPYICDGAELRTFTASQVRSLASDLTVYHWGTYDAGDEPMLLTWRKYRERFICDHDFTRANQVTYNALRVEGRCKTRIKWLNSFSDAIFVEYYVPSQPNRQDWGSLWLVWQKEGTDWYLSGVAHDQWSI